MQAVEYQFIAESMAQRARQWKSRLTIGGIIAGVSFPLTSWAFALGWFLVYALLQGFESRLHPDGALAQRMSRKRYIQLCLVQTILNNFAFSAYGAAEILSGSVLGLACGTLIIGGVIINAVIVSPGSRTMLFAALGPQAAYLPLLPIGALNAGLSPGDAFQISFAGVMLVLACLAIRGQIARMFAETQAARAHAEHANQVKSQFLATMSHEIRTPMNGVMGMAQAMQADALSPVQRERLEIITQSGQSLLHILGDVLDLSKIEAGKLTLEETAFDLEQLTDGVRATFQAIAVAKGLSFEVSIAPEARGAWRGDPTRLRQILANLISNAIKFTDAGTVSVSAASGAGGLILTVADTGPGVTPEQLTLLFRKFVQADESTTRLYGGTGLGLSICRDLTSLMGGEIHARHAEPHGLVFEVDLPLQRADAPALTPTAPDAKPVALGGQTLRILAAEDHPVNRQVLTLLLAQAGLTPHLVENGQEAVEAWRSGDWDLILMDVQMPVMDGPTASSMIRSEEAASGRPRTPIIALTANVMTQQIEAYRAAGMDQSVAKPIEVSALLGAIAESQLRRAA